MQIRTRSRQATLMWPLLILLLILAFNLFFTRNFWRIEVRDGHLFGSTIDILRRAAPLILISTGMTLVIATGGIDISVGAISAISGAVAALLLRGGDISYLSGIKYAGTPLTLVLLGALAASIVCGSFNGSLVAFVGIQPIVATLILMVMGRGIALLLTGGYVLTFEFPPFQFIGTGYFLGLPFGFVLTLIVLGVTALVTRFTPTGLFIQSVGGNSRASRYTGINSRVVKLMVYMFSGLCAGIAGLIIAGDISGADAHNAGLWIELDAILAVVIGGTALTGGRYKLAGTIIGALIIQSLTTTILTRGVPVEYTLIVKAVVVVAVILIQSGRFRQQVFGWWRRRRPA